MIDLHIHSSFSDGTDAPEALVGLACRLGLSAVALTDHDTTGGVAAFLAACRSRKLTGFAGVEVSVEVPSGTLHLLGLGIDPACQALAESLARVQDGRDWRNHRILEKLLSLGLALTWEEVAAFAGEEVVGRPHFALALIARGWVANQQEAFDRFLANGAPAYVDRYRLTPAEALGLIRQAGGVAIMAHPYAWCDDLPLLESRIEALKADGLAGIEAYYPNHTQEMTIDLLRLAKRQNLLVSGGSDYHGRSLRPDIALGTGSGRLCIPDSLVPKLVAAIGPNGHYHWEA